MPKASEFTYEAVFFLSDHQVRNQMRYTEFEALLDGVVTLSDCCDQDVHAVYLQLDERLGVKALVFFLVYFDEEGRADGEWNIPLARLAKISGAGPDLGAGPIRLATRGQCAISWHQKDLWDPALGPARNDLHAIVKAVVGNRLGFKIKEPQAAAVPPPKEAAAVHSAYESDEDIPLLETAVDESESHEPKDAEVLDERFNRQRTARLLRSQRLRIRTLISQQESETEELMRQHRLETQAYRTQMRENEQALARYKVLNEQLKNKLERRNDQYETLKTEVTQYKKRFAVLEKELSQTLSAQEAERLKSRMEGELSILREQLDRREAEMFYRDEREEQLKSEIHSLKEQLQAIEKSEIIHKLAALDVVFVVYHPGAGHITLPAQDVAVYAESPTAYVAERCFVTEEHYRYWLEHYESPVCTHLDSNGDICGETVARVAAPSDFEFGVNDRCEKHRR